MGLHYEHRPASTMVYNFVQHTMSTSVNRAVNVLGMGPSAGYNFFQFVIRIMLHVVIGMSSFHAVDATVNHNYTHMYIHVMTNLLLCFFWVKLTLKIPKFLTKATAYHYVQSLHLFLFGTCSAFT